jgi:hypothetical protein
VGEPVVHHDWHVLQVNNVDLRKLVIAEVLLYVEIFFIASNEIYPMDFVQMAQI